MYYGQLGDVVIGMHMTDAGLFYRLYKMQRIGSISGWRVMLTNDHRSDLVIASHYCKISKKMKNEGLMIATIQTILNKLNQRLHNNALSIIYKYGGDEMRTSCYQKIVNDAIR